MKFALFTLLAGISTFFSNHSFAQRIAAGGRHSLAICVDSTVEAWGYNGYGQLGNGNQAEQHSGTQVIGLTGVIQVAGGLFHSLFVKNDATVWSCGRNTLGPLGDGTNADKSTPVQVSEVTDIIQAAGGGEHSLFLKRDSTVWVCGNNSSGQLGDGTSVSKNTPVQLIGLTGVVQVAGGAEFSLFLKNDGTVWACGHNGFGQFGNGTNVSSNVPIQVSGLSGIVQLSAGEWHSLFVKEDGSVFSSGRNQYGQLGDGTTEDKNSAEQISTISDIIQAEAGGIHSVFLKKDGSVWACGLNSGDNNNGQLGDGTSVDKLSPVQVISTWGDRSIVRAEATREHSLFQVADGLLFAAGRNNYGQLGYGDFTTFNSDTPVVSSTVCISIPTSLDVISNADNELHIFPNPGTGVFFLKSILAASHVEVTTILGKKVYSRSNLQHQQHHQIEINITDQPKGMYIVRIMDSNGRIHAKNLVLQ